MRVLIFLLSIVATVFLVLAEPRRTSRIVGGSAASIADYPYMSNLQYRLSLFWMQWCGGTLLTSRSIMTAAHCIYFSGTSPLSWRVRLGSSYASRDGQIFDVLRIVTHEDYDDLTLNNDVAVIILMSSATFSNNIALARIPGVNFKLPDGFEVVAVGWGSLWLDGPAPEQLQHVDLNIINQELCAERYNILKKKLQAAGKIFPHKVNDGTVCAGTLDVGGKDTCHGDSGGPLSLRHPDGDIVYGITSWGYECGRDTYPGVSARVSYYSEWIFEKASLFV